MGIADTVCRALPFDFGVCIREAAYGNGLLDELFVEILLLLLHCETKLSVVISSVINLFGSSTLSFNLEMLFP